MPEAATDISVTPVLAEILRTGRVRDGAGALRELHSHISPQSGAMLQQIIRELDAQVTLEIGLAYGVSALFICEAIADKPGARHITLDPFQHDEFWSGIGLRNLHEAGFDRLLDFREAPAHQAIPDLEREGVKVDFALVDGWHTFDYVMVDMFLVDRVLRVGGVMTIDDTEWPGVRKACRYFLTNRRYRVVRCWGEAPDEPRHPRLREAIGRLSQRVQALRKLLKPELALRDEDIGLKPGCRCVAMVKQADDDLRECFGHEVF